MTLVRGTRIGNYEVLGPLGAGGMGEVYRARDTRLDRTAAIKALPPAFATDAERLARFEREARLLAALTHPNIAGIYGLEESEGTPYLVLEFVEGETLAQRLARGALPLHDALEVAVQIAAAVEAAHERGIVHRDLKPGNVMLTTERVVKVLDFGLAKGGAGQGPASGLDLSASPTVALAATGVGVILGTASYMSPEQARGREVDRRADVWAFGCLLYECLTGRQAFEGETVSDVIARILEREPDWNALPASAPARLRELMKRCLTKDAGERPRDIGDIRRELTAIRLDLSGAGRSVVAPTDTPSLAVLYFENLADDKESEYFCSGITEDILTDLSKIKGLRVASRNAVARYRGGPADVSKIAAELGVGAVLEGSVRRAGERMRITVQLVSGVDGFQMWAERYDRTLQDVFAVQEEIAKAIADALRVTLSPAETRALVKDRPKDAQAYDLYLKGRAHYNRYAPDDWREAQGLFEQAIALDANYALAWAGVADCCGQMLQWDILGDRAGIEAHGLEAAARAIALDPKLADGYKARALVLRSSGRYEEANASLLQAVEANPRHTPSLINLGGVMYARANLAGVERVLRRVLELDPQEQFAIGWILYLMGETSRAAQALEWADRLRELSDSPFYRDVATGAYATQHLERGDLEAARRTMDDGLAEGADPVCMRAIEAAIAARSGRNDDASRLLAELRDAKIFGAGFMILAADTAIRMRDMETAAGFLSRQVFRELAPVSIRLTSGLHPLLDHPSFGPRRSDMTLVWPLEAPMMRADVHALFKEVRIESGLPKGSDLGLR